MVALCLESIHQDAKVEETVKRITADIETSLKAIGNKCIDVIEDNIVHAFIRNQKQNNQMERLTTPSLTPYNGEAQSISQNRLPFNNIEPPRTANEASIDNSTDPFPITTYVINIDSKEQVLDYMVAWDFITPGKPVDLHLVSHSLLQLSTSKDMS